MIFSEGVILAFETLKANKLRAFLTLLSISIGVFTIMLTGTIVSTLDNTIQSELASLGENAFQFMRVPNNIIGGPAQRRKYYRRKKLDYRIYKNFKKEMQTETPFVTAEISTEGKIVKYRNLETDPNVELIGTEEYYFNINNLNIDEGRPFTEPEINQNRNVVLLGRDVVVKIFNNENPIGKKVKIGNIEFEVLGLLEAKGAILGQSQDNKVIIPLGSYIKYFSNQWESLTISVKALDKNRLEESKDNAIGTLRSLRNLKPWEENDFEINTNEAVSSQFGGLTSFIGFFGNLVGWFALVASGIGIMNIMLVSVKERTREIGVRKALGAKRSWILTQILIETITITLVGGLIGISLGLIIALGFGMAMNLEFIFPILPILQNLAICILIGGISGIYPAWRASGLDPIESLRYE